MEDSKLLKKIYMRCPLCGKEHEVEERERTTSLVIKGQEVTYVERYYLCRNTSEDENEFETGAMSNANLLNARNAYRIQNGLLTSDEIVKLRESYGLSQVDLAKLLGWGEATISRYESKAIQDEAYDTMLRLILSDPLKALEFLDKNGSKFTSSKKEQIRSKLLEKLEDYGKENLTRQILKGEYVNFLEPSDANGFTALNIDKIEAVISYFAKKIPNLFKVKLMKLLWYADVVAYCVSGHSMTGIVYRHEPLGALPVGHYNLMSLEYLNVKEEPGLELETRYHIYPSEKINDSVLSESEKAILDRIVEKFKKYKTKEIVDYMHEEVAYIQTNPGEIIPFSLAKKIRRI